MKIRQRRKNNLHELIHREYGVPCPYWSSIRALRHSVFGPRRQWKLVLKTKENSLLELSSDLMWVTRPLQLRDGKSSIMHRICSDGHLMPLYRVDIHPRPKEILIYDIPHPTFKSSIPEQEYRPVMCALRKGNILTRHDLHNGKLYNHIHLGQFQRSSITPSFMQDMLVVKSPKLRYEQQPECFFHFDVFQMHPFGLIASFNIDGIVFPGLEHRRQYGRLRTAEIHDGMLLVMTDKNYSLIYNAQEIIEAKKVIVPVDGSNEPVEFPSELVTEAPPLLFVTYAHLDIVGMGACPWTYIHAVSDYLLEVRDLQTDELLEGGKVTWRDKTDQQISPDYLMFFPDDSNRLVHVKTAELRVLAIEENNGKRELKEVFHYPEKPRITEISGGDGPMYSRSGRLLKPKFKFDDSLHRTLAFDVEMDLMVLVILEAKRDVGNICVNLVKAVFYDSLTYEFLHELKINEKVDGDIETNRLTVHMERDIINIVSHKGSSRTVLTYRLQEVKKIPKNSSPRRKSKIIVCSEDFETSDYESVQASDSEFVSAEDEASAASERGNRRRRSLREANRQRVLRRRSTRNERSSRNNDESDTNSASSDEWHP